MYKILIVCAHPDDETLGMGGTIARLVNENNTIHVLFITDGSSSQYENYREMIEIKKIEMKNALNELGVQQFDFHMLPDMQLDVTAQIKINAVIVDKISQFKPDIVYTHFWGDINSDHRRVFDSTMVAVRPTVNQSVKCVYCYETPSSTEWQAPKNDSVFNPNRFVDITDFHEKKISALKFYKSELREFPHPRSEKAVSIYDQRNGIVIARKYAERFVVIREII